MENIEKNLDQHKDLPNTTIPDRVVLIKESIERTTLPEEIIGKIEDIKQAIRELSTAKMKAGVKEDGRMDRRKLMDMDSIIRIELLENIMEQFNQRDYHGSEQH